jgi:3-hydroxybutyrate dehydrogenase/3-oxoacyl-[acyl-carrier protein] reductase
MKDQGYNFTAYPCDVSDYDSAQTCIAAVERDIGPVDVLVNNAGITRDMTFKKMDKVNWDAVMKTNLDSVFNMTKPVADGMVDRGWGRIINISSVEGKQANKPAISHYITNKHAIHGLTKATAFEYGTQGITCNAICPGAVDTDLMRAAGPAAAEAEGISYEEWLGRFAEHAATKKITTVEQIAAVASLLASDAGAGITGTLISVDGGTAQW